MKSTIRILPEQLCNKIAAGEVVERPASVVKELVENALDAGAKAVRIEVEAGGRRLIRVSDDGHGMSRDDALLCLERHATSKIGSEEDLSSLVSMGFRGEALPSVASVSRLELRTRQAEAEGGWRIYAEGGMIKTVEEVGMPVGTTLTVRNLFFNTPARRKFMRREQTELGHVSEVTTRLALGRPDVGFRLLHNGRALFETPAGGLEERIAGLLGRPLMRDLIPVEQEAGALRLHGYLCRPEAARSSSGGIYTFINHRYIRDRVVQHGVMEGYRSLLLKGRYPVTVLFLDIEPGQVDVNVHPTKHEVRFRDQSAVHDFIAASVRETLRSADLATEPVSNPAAMPAAPPAEKTDRVPKDSPPAAGGRGIAAAPSAAPPRRELAGVQEALTGYARRSAGHQGPAFRSPPTALPSPGPATPPALAEADEAQRGFFASLRYLGQYRRSYLLCQDGDDLILVDQHAAHERIRFEELRGQFAAGRVERQSLLFPEVLELDFREAALLGEKLDELARLGFELEPFGGNAYALKAVPRALAAGEPAQLVRDVAAELGEKGASNRADEALEELLMGMACHGSVRANQSLESSEVEALFSAMDRIDFRAHCPHGRPVMKRLPLAEIERLFKRT